MLKKYCIYKNPNGKTEVWEYIDNIMEIDDNYYLLSYFQKYGGPVCVNKLGGFHSCDESRKVAIIESDHWPNIASDPHLFSDSINNPDFHCGWVDSKGNTYKCDYMEHTSLAIIFCTTLYPESYSKWRRGNIDIPDDFLISLGWIRVGTDNQQYDYNKVSNEALAVLEKLKNRYNR